MTQRSITLQCILFFVLAKADGKSRLQAVQGFLKTRLFQQLEEPTVGDVYALADAAGY